MKPECSAIKEKNVFVIYLLLSYLLLDEKPKWQSSKCANFIIFAWGSNNLSLKQHNYGELSEDQTHYKTGLLTIASSETYKYIFTKHQGA